MTTAAACVVAVGILAVSGYGSQMWAITGRAPPSTAPGGAAVSALTPAQRSRVHIRKFTPNAVNPYQYVLEFFAELPAGTSLDQSQFDQAVGKDSADFLRSIGVTHITSSATTVNVSLKSAYLIKTDAADIRLDPTMAFTHKVTANGTLICDNITGIEVNANWLLGWMPVKHVEISHDAAGNTTIVVQISSAFGTIKRTIRLDPNGKTIP